MMASLPLTGTAPSSPDRSVACSVAAVLLALACLFAAVPTAYAAGARASAEHARPLAHAARGCAPARGMLFTRHSVLRSQRRLLCLMNRARSRFGLRPLR